MAAEQSLGIVEFCLEPPVLLGGFVRSSIHFQLPLYIYGMATRDDDTFILISPHAHSSGLRREADASPRYAGGVLRPFLWVPLSALVPMMRWVRNTTQTRDLHVPIGVTLEQHVLPKYVRTHPVLGIVDTRASGLDPAGFEIIAEYYSSSGEPYVGHAIPDSATLDLQRPRAPRRIDGQSSRLACSLVDIEDMLVGESSAQLEAPSFHLLYRASGAPQVVRDNGVDSGAVGNKRARK